MGIYDGHIFMDAWPFRVIEEEEQLAPETRNRISELVSKYFWDLV